MVSTIPNLVEIDTLEATVIIDNEIDVISSIAPNTVANTGRMSNLALGQPDLIHDRGEVKKEVPMESICCGAHGLSILVVRVYLPPQF